MKGAENKAAAIYQYQVGCICVGHETLAGQGRNR
ncbi:hypothetical protein Amal_03823 [Acetobacter malorum]|uniref:Uncharacterized protein n=1 Tax=Acetobacter malorum TaxID=178901 RepID=A0A177G3X9_9PROT|nr:hypothetical protein Amal_03823 [Acetobacter malorum]